MEIQDKWTIASILSGWLLTVIGFVKAYGNLAQKEECVTPAECRERMEAFGRETSLQFGSGDTQFELLWGTVQQIDARQREMDDIQNHRHNEVLDAIRNIRK